MPGTKFDREPRAYMQDDDTRHDQEGCLSEGQGDPELCCIAWIQGCCREVGRAISVFHEGLRDEENDGDNITCREPNMALIEG